MDLAQAALVREERQVAPNPVARDLRLSDRSSTVTLGWFTSSRILRRRSAGLIDGLPSDRSDIFMRPNLPIWEEKPVVCPDDGENCFILLTPKGPRVGGPKARGRKHCSGPR